MAFRIYKPGQGRYVRTATGVLLGLWGIYGCSALSNALSDSGELPGFLKPIFLGQAVTYSQVVPVAVFIALVLVVVWFLNWPKFADFLIETEIEMARVAWPGRNAVIGSSVVVVVTVVVMSFVLFGIDQLLYVIFRLLRVY